MPRPEIRDGLLIGIAALLPALLLAWIGGLQPLETTSERWRSAWFAAGPQANEPIVLIALDQASLDWGQRENSFSWPWPRAAYAPVVDFCRRAGARSLSFDVLFTEPSIYGVEDDQAFAAALLNFPATVGSFALGVSGGGDAEIPPADPRLQTFSTLRSAEQAALPVSPLRESFGQLGDVGAQPDPDGLFRHVTLASRLGNQTLPALSLAAFLVANPQARLEQTPQELHIGNSVVPLDDQGRSRLRYRGPAASFRTLSAAAIIQSELQLLAGESPTLDPQFLHGAHVIFGLTAPGLFDLRPVPLDGVFPGMEIHATALDNLLAGDFLRVVTPGIVNSFALLLAILAGLSVRFCRNLVQTLAAVVLLLPLALLAGFVAYAWNWWLPVALPVTATALALIGGVATNFATEGRKKREIRRAFNQYLHPSVIEQLVDHPEKLRLGGEKRELSIFFSDLQGFSTISEQLEPEALIALLNAYLTEMTDIILDRGGTIDKYEGDAIIAFWNAPLEQPDHACRAVDAAMACQQRLAQLRPVFRERFGHDLIMRIGVNTGPAVVGNMGSTRRFDYTMLGDAVNLAARLEGVNKVFGTDILLAQSTRVALGQRTELREIARVRVVGRREPVQIFTPLTADASLPLAEFDAARQLFVQGRFQAAEQAFQLLSAADPVAAAYVFQCRQLQQQKPADWQGIWDLSAK
jgi:adenylate cyclase